MSGFDHERFYTELEARGVVFADKKACSPCGTISFKYLDKKANMYRSKSYGTRKAKDLDAFIDRVYKDIGDPQ